MKRIRYLFFICMLPIWTASGEESDSVIQLQNGDTKVTLPRLESKRLTYTEKTMWVYLTVSNTAKSKPGKPWSNISQSGSLAVLDTQKTLKELAQEEKEMHARNHDSTVIMDFQDGAKMLAYESYTDRKRMIERRCVLWWRSGMETIKLDFSFFDFASSSGRKRGRQIVIDTLEGMRVNGQPVPAVKPFLEILEDSKQDALISL